MNQGKCICMAFMNIQLGGVLHNIYTWLNGQKPSDYTIVFNIDCKIYIGI